MHILTPTLGCPIHFHYLTDNEEAKCPNTSIGIQGTFDLNGRSITGEGLPCPISTAQAEGRVVVTITVNPEGEVVGNSINLRTNTSDPELRKASEEAQSTVGGM